MGLVVRYSVRYCFSLVAVTSLLFAVIRSPSWGSSGVAGPASHTPSNIQVQLNILLFLAWCGYGPLGAGSSLSADFMIPRGGVDSSLICGYVSRFVRLFVSRFLR